MKTSLLLTLVPALDQDIFDTHGSQHQQNEYGEPWGAGHNISTHSASKGHPPLFGKMKFYSKRKQHHDNVNS